MPDWAKHLTEDQQKLVINKKWKTIGDLADGYSNVERFNGKLTGGKKAMELPGDDTPPEKVAEFYGALGKPEKPEGYELANIEGIPSDDPMLTSAPQIFHDLNLTKAQSDGLKDFYLGHMKSAVESGQAADAERLATQQREFVSKQGGKLDATIAAADAAVKAYGDVLTDERVSALRDHPAWGVAATMQFLAGLGQKTMESRAVNGETAPTGFGHMTPDAAAAELKKQTPILMAEIQSGDPEKAAKAKAKMESLMKAKHGIRS